jgi:hypothetical protein
MFYYTRGALDRAWCVRGARKRAEGISILGPSLTQMATRVTAKRENKWRDCVDGGVMVYCPGYG